MSCKIGYDLQKRLNQALKPFYTIPTATTPKGLARIQLQSLAMFVSYLTVGMHRISGWPVIRPDNPAFFDFRYPAGYRIRQSDIRSPKKPDIRPNMQLRNYI